MVVDAQRKPNKLTLREFLAREDARTLAIVGTFLVTWIGSVVLFKVRRVEERWGGHVLED